jgi:YbbR domain-containing protein
VVNPFGVVITGKADVLAGISTLTLHPVDLSGNTSSVTFVITIAYPAGVTGSRATARVTYSIAANPTVQSTPTPSP